jgi:hypothetical protein
MLILRTVSYTIHASKSVTDHELLVTLQNSHDSQNAQFDFPAELPTRYASRAQQLSEDSYQVSSLPFDTSLTTDQASLRVNGLWINRNDGSARGGVSPAVFGIPLSKRVIESLWLLPASIVQIAYHGTSEDAWKSISESKTLRASPGQIGTGVYVGSFWKACRFALRDQSYAWRESNRVLRVLWKAETIDSYPALKACSCLTFCTGRLKEKAHACDHDRNWATEKLDGAELRIGQYSDGTWITRNEEWVVNPNSILRLGEAVHVVRTSACQTVYDPYQRDLKIH